MTEIRADLLSCYPLKALFEEVLGRKSFRAVKESGSFAAWKEESRRLLKALGIAITATVEVADDQWRLEVAEMLELGEKRIDAAKEFDELLAGLAATLGRLCFLQVGFVPYGHGHQQRVPLNQANWRLDIVRTVQYIQTPEQKERLSQILERRIGVPKVGDNRENLKG